MLRKTLQTIFILASLLMVTSLAVVAQTDQPSMVVIPGTIQSALGCTGDWQTDCEATALTFSEKDQLWEGTFDLPAGSYEYKVALNGTWDVNYGLHAEPGGANIPLVLETDTKVTFIYSDATHWVTDSVNSVIANVPGSFQDEIGCPGEWQPDCLRTLLQDPDGDGTYTYTTSAIPAGDYEAKVAVDGSWTVNYGEDGAPGGANFQFTVPADNTETVFSFELGDAHHDNHRGRRGAADNRQLETGDGAVGFARYRRLEYCPHPRRGVPLILFCQRQPQADRCRYRGRGRLRHPQIGSRWIRRRDPRQIPPASDYTALKIDAADLDQLPDILRDQTAIAAYYNGDVFQDATSLQIPGVLDDLYAYDGDLGAHFYEGAPLISVWAPTAQNVRLYLYDNSNAASEPTIHDMDFDAETGVWAVWGDPDWKGKYYLFEVTVYAPTTQKIETNLVTDPYSVSLSTNSTRSQIVDLNDPALMPEGWQTLEKPPLAAPEDSVIYELHVRDFSAYDDSVPAEDQGKFTAFTDTNSNGMRHLEALAQAGLTHIHLLPVFDFATTDENPANRVELNRAGLAALPPDSDSQQAAVTATANDDAYNWGYDPLHYTVPEGSYSTNPDGSQRILEFREMVQALNQSGLRVVMDVVYNHTNASGEDANSVLDRIVPGYYQRLDEKGRVDTSTCCSNTATEHRMMEKLMLELAAYVGDRVQGRWLPLRLDGTSSAEQHGRRARHAAQSDTGQ